MDGGASAEPGHAWSARIFAPALVAAKIGFVS
jgi:hypothetical protein